MQSLKEVSLGWKTLRSTRNTLKLTFFFAFVLFTILCLIRNAGPAFQAFSFTSLSLLERITLFFSTLYNLSASFTPVTLTIALITSIVSGISIVAAYEYFMIRKQVIDSGSVALASIAYIFVIIGIHCASCSIIVIGTLISVFGNLIIPEAMTGLSVWFGVLGIVIQIVVLWFLLGKLSKPLTC